MTPIVDVGREVVESLAIVEKVVEGSEAPRGIAVVVGAVEKTLDPALWSAGVQLLDGSVESGGLRADAEPQNVSPAVLESSFSRTFRKI